MFRRVSKLGPGVMPLNFAFLLMIVLLRPQGLFGRSAERA